MLLTILDFSAANVNDILTKTFLFDMESDENGSDSYLFRIGEERIHSIQNLFKYFCYHLHRGEWELSQACVDQLHSEGICVGVNLKEILHDVVQFPFSRRYFFLYFYEHCMQHMYFGEAPPLLPQSS